MDRPAAVAYCGFLTLHGLSVIVAGPIVGSGVPLLIWVLFALCVSVAVLCIAAAGRMYPPGPMVVIAGADCAVRFGVAVLGAMFWLNMTPFLGSASIILGALGWGLTEHYHDSDVDDWKRVDRAIQGARSLPPPTKAKDDRA
jgi:Na+/proline symporter